MLKNSENIKYYFDYHLVNLINGDVEKMNEKEILDLMVDKCVKKVKIIEEINDNVRYIRFIENGKNLFAHKDFLFDEYDKAKFVFIFFIKMKFDKGEKNKKYYVILDKQYNLLKYPKYLKLQDLIEEEIEKYIQIYPEMVLKYQKYLKE
jgi:hypothetical protein